MAESHIMKRVAQMYMKFGYSYTGPPRSLGPDERLQRGVFLEEELREFATSVHLVDQYDAMLDLIIFAVGTIEQMGLPLKEGFNAVMDANMRKVPGDKGRGTKNDMIKPEGWVGPEEQLNFIIREWSNPETVELPKSESGEGVKKWDDSKPPLTLLPLEVLTEVAKVMQMGAKKYGRDNWRSGVDTPAWSRVSSSALRHFLAWMGGEDYDSESGLHHLDHAITQLMFLRFYIMRGWGDDFRT